MNQLLLDPDISQKLVREREGRIHAAAAEGRLARIARRALRRRRTHDAAPNPSTTKPSTTQPASTRPRPVADA